jgi:hypothetical protein
MQSSNWRWRSRCATVWNTFVFADKGTFPWLWKDCEVPSYESALTERHISNFDNTSMWVVIFVLVLLYYQGRFIGTLQTVSIEKQASSQPSQRIHSLGWESNPIQGVRNQELTNSIGTLPPTKLWELFIQGCEEYYYLHCSSSERK